jgi:hypothetical protein
MIDWYRQRPAHWNQRRVQRFPGLTLNTSTTHPKRSLVHFLNIKLLSSDAGCTTFGEQESGELKIPQYVGIFAFEGCYAEKMIVVTLAIPAPFPTVFS